MTLRSASAGQNKMSQNINGIAQSSWVAGGYWGSPNKNNRSPLNYQGIHSMHQQVPPQPFHVPPQPLQAPANEAEGFPQSRSSSQSSGFVSHGSGSQTARNGNIFRGPIDARNDDIDHASVSSEFVWNYESCDTSSQSSQNLDDVDPFLRHRSNVFPNISANNNNDARSLRSGATTATSQYSSAAASSVLSPQQQMLWGLQPQQGSRRSPYDDLQNMRALSRLSQHEISDDDLSLLSQRSIEVQYLQYFINRIIDIYCLFSLFYFRMRLIYGLRSVCWRIVCASSDLTLRSVTNE